MVNDQEELTKYVEGENGLWWVRGGGSDNLRSWNGIRYKTGLSGKNTSAKNLSMNVATVPPGAIAYAHIHDGFDVMLFLLQGKVRHEYGPNLGFRSNTRLAILSSSSRVCRTKSLTSVMKTWWQWSPAPPPMNGTRSSISHPSIARLRRAVSCDIKTDKVTG